MKYCYNKNFPDNPELGDTYLNHEGVQYRYHGPYGWILIGSPVLDPISDWYEVPPNVYTDEEMEEIFSLFHLNEDGTWTVKIKIKDFLNDKKFKQAMKLIEE